MSQGTASDVLRDARLRAEAPASGSLFRLHPVVRRDVVALAGIGGIACLGTALLSMHFRPELRSPASLVLVLFLEVAVLTAATAVTLWALGLAVQADPIGVRQFNLLFPMRPGTSLSWDQVERVEARRWVLGVRPGYPATRLCLILRDGDRRILPPLEGQDLLLEIARRRIEERRGRLAG